MGYPRAVFWGPYYSFCILMTSLSEVVSSSVKIFADDTKLYNKDSNSDIIQQDLDA